MPQDRAERLAGTTKANGRNALLPRPSRWVGGMHDLATAGLMKKGSRRVCVCALVAGMWSDWTGWMRGGKAGRAGSSPDSVGMKRGDQ